MKQRGVHASTKHTSSLALISAPSQWREKGYVRKSFLCSGRGSSDAQDYDLQINYAFVIADVHQGHRWLRERLVKASGEPRALPFRTFVPGHLARSRSRGCFARRNW